MKSYITTPYVIAVLSLALMAFVLIQNALAVDQGNMHRALDELKAARGSLHEARGSKAGHRQAAIDLVDQALGEVRAGIAAGEEH